MEINATTLQNLDPNRSYYLSSTTGEIKRAGFVQWFKCFFGVGDGRAKAAALAAKVKEALLADGQVESDAILDSDIRGLDTTRSLSGVELRGIASRFRASHTEAVGRADARRAAETIADELVGTWTQNRLIHPDPVSVGYVKRLAVYAASPVIANAANYDSDNALKRAMSSKMDLLQTVLRETAPFSQRCKLGYPVEQELTKPDGTKFMSRLPLLKLDELHFRLILACMTDGDGDVRLNECYTALHNFPERDLAFLESEIKSIPLMDAARPGAVVAFKNAFMEKSNNYAVSHNCIYGGRIPKRVDGVLREYFGELRKIYGERAISQTASLADLVNNRMPFFNALQPFISTANAEHRLIRQSEVKQALDVVRDECRLGAAASFLRATADEFLAGEGGGKVHPTFGRDLVKRNTALRDDLIACSSPKDTEAFMLKYEGVIRDHITFEKSVTDERDRLPERAAVKIAEALGMTVNQVKDVTNFDRLDSKAGDIMADMLDGTYPGSREKGFDVPAAYNAVLDKFVKTRVDLIRAVDDANGVSDDVKAKWKELIFKSDKPDDFHASKLTKILELRGDALRKRLDDILEHGITADERAKRLCEFFGSLNAEFVNLFGEDEWIDMGAPGHDTAFRMILHAVTDKVPNFADKLNEVRNDLNGIRGGTFAKYENLGIGSDIRDYLCYDIVPEVNALEE